MTNLSQKSKLELALHSSQTTSELLDAFTAMENSGAFSPKDLSLASLKVAETLHQLTDQPEKVLPFAARALKELDTDSHPPSSDLVSALRLMGYLNGKLNMFGDAIAFLDRANTLLGKLQDEGLVGLDEPLFRTVQIDLANVHAAALNFKEALPFCLKALEIDVKRLGPDSIDVATDRRVLGAIYAGLKEYEKALQQNVLALRISRERNLCIDVLLLLEIDSAKSMIALRRYDEAVATLKNVVQRAYDNNHSRALAFLTMAKAFHDQGKFADCKRYLETTLGILGKRERVFPMEVTNAYSEIWMMYESMKEYEAAIALLKRSFALVENLPQGQNSKGSVSGRIGLLLMMTGKVQQSIPYLESAVENMKISFGPKHFGVGYQCNNLGTAYMKLDKPQLAAKMFAEAKDIMEASLGPHHANTIGAYQNLSQVYVVMKSYGPAIELQKQVVKAWESHGPVAEDKLREARQLLENLKKEAPAFFEEESPM